MANCAVECQSQCTCMITDAGGLISIAEYGQEYGQENPIRVLYHGSGHYDALHIPGKKSGRSKL
ncbi:hypothetical protein Patl1_20618 [Pistacia atlantica]|uniref:Uncharacterized protein n=1 Tax=Pistacia atlantica TaxID=434234 RepID=A0ACC1BLZ8_9ROSI|nr:hypothetical protein Patl1_20618 [Pistacia atlantica]